MKYIFEEGDIIKYTYPPEIKSNNIFVKIVEKVENSTELSYDTIIIFDESGRFKKGERVKFGFTDGIAIVIHNKEELMLELL